MKKKFIKITVLFTMVFLFVTGGICFYLQSENPDELRAEQRIKLNEIEQLSKAGESQRAAEAAAQMAESVREMGISENDIMLPLIMGGICLVFLFCVLAYIWSAILRPFDKMKVYAERLAQGNFDIPLAFERSNYFGEFTWAFDSMRREITKARACEKEAVENNKTVIATLSHDIKTPLSSIRAYAEGLEANLDSSMEKRAKYMNVIMRKCDEVTKLVNDLFLHSLSDMDKLKVQKESFDICGFMEQALWELAAERGDIVFEKPVFQVEVMADRKRLMQITENLVNNARKYAKSKIDIDIVKQDEEVQIHFRDHGTGIPDEDMPFIFDKFYRGRNCGDEPGSGLGLYIVKYLAEKMGAKILLHNHADGLEAILILRIS